MHGVECSAACRSIDMSFAVRAAFIAAHEDLLTSCGECPFERLGQRRIEENTVVNLQNRRVVDCILSVYVIVQGELVLLSTNTRNALDDAGL